MEKHGVYGAGTARKEPSKREKFIKPIERCQKPSGTYIEHPTFLVVMEVLRFHPLNPWLNHPPRSGMDRSTLRSVHDACAQTGVVRNPRPGQVSLVWTGEWI